MTLLWQFLAVSGSLAAIVAVLIDNERAAQRPPTPRRPWRGLWLREELWQ
jgi:hypothetical protein